MKRLKLFLCIIFLSNFIAIFPVDAQVTKNNQLATAQSMTSDNFDYGANYILVKYKNDPEIHIVLIEENNNILRAKVAQVQGMSQDIIGNNFSIKSELLNTKEKATAKKKLQSKLDEVLKDPNVEIAQPEYFYKLEAWTRDGNKDYPNDFNPNYSPLNRHWYYDQSHLAEMWQDQNCQGLGGASPCGGSPTVKVAVIDTGLAYQSRTSTYGDVFEPASEVNTANVVNPYNSDQEAYCYVKQYIKNKYNSGVVCTTSELAERSYADDDNGHGTLVTGLISSKVDNGAGINTGSVSPAFNVSIMPIKANYFHTGIFPVYRVEEGNTIREVLGTLGIYYGLNHARINGANVINMSFGSVSPFDALTKSQLDAASAVGIILVAPSGNGGSDDVGDATINFPAGYDNVIAVGAVNPNNLKSTYSNYGTALDMVAYVGDNIDGRVFQQSYECFFTVNSTSTQGNDCQIGNRIEPVTAHQDFYTSNNLFDFVTGTSFASPQVSAAVALFKSKNPSASIGEVVTALYASTDDVTNYGTGWDQQTGFGIVNFEKINQVNPATFSKSFFPFYATYGAQSNTWVIVGNPSATDASLVTVDIAGIKLQTQLIGAGKKGVFYFDSIINGPVTITSDKPVYVTQRELYGNSFNEYSSINPASLSTKYYFPFYSTNTNKNPISQTWIVIGNPSSATESANVTIKVAGVVRGTDVVLPGMKSTQYYPNVTDGPVEITSDQPIYVTQREIFGISFNEYKGIDANNLSNHYFFPYYATDSNTSNTWVIIGNPSVSQTANVTIKVAGIVKGLASILPGQKSVQYYPNTTNGPVEITSDINVYVTQRELFKNSFNEYEGIDAEKLVSKYYFPLYATNGGMSNTWIIIGNPSSTLSSNITIKVAGITKGTATILPGQKSVQYYPNTIDGPVEINSDQPVYITQRELFGDSFNEYSGISM